jgi:hypothetical protein
MELANQLSNTNAYALMCNLETASTTLHIVEAQLPPTTVQTFRCGNIRKLRIFDDPKRHWSMRSE